TPLGIAAETENPSFLALDPRGKYLYAANEISDYQGQKSGGVSAFEIDRDTGKLKFLNEVSSRGPGPCYVTVDRTGKYVLVANYDGGSVAAFPILQDGRLAEASSVVQHQGHGPNPERQERPHAHQIELTRDNRYALAADLGLDKLLVYKFDATKGSLTANDPPYGEVPPAAGPRHFVFHPNGRFVYVINEMGGSVTEFSYDPRTGSLRSLKTVSSLPKEFKGSNDSAEIEVHPSGKFLYASNRGPDNIAVFTIDRRNGSLTPVDHISTRGKAPRNFGLDQVGQVVHPETLHRQAVHIGHRAQVGEQLRQWVPARNLGVAVGRDHEKRLRVLRPQQVAQHQHRRARRPVQVVDDEHDRRPLRRRADEPGGGLEEVVAVGLRVARRRHRQLGQAQLHLGDEARQHAAVGLDVGVQVLDRAHLHVLAQRLGERLVRDSELLVAPTPQDGGAGAVGPQGELGGETGLADAGL